MNKCSFITTSLLLAGSISMEAQQKQPNIVLFLVDDMGWQDTSLPFWKEQTELNRRYHTPNMERLAKQGMKFTSAYACSVSSPSRVSLFTGMNAARHRVTNWTLYKNQEVDSKHHLLGYPDWNVNGLSPVKETERTFNALSLAQALKDGGYYTIHCGKAHFGAIGTPAENPLAIGFDVNIAGHACGGPGSYLAEENYGNKLVDGKKSVWGVPGLEKYHGTDVFLTEALTREAIDQLDKREQEKPFFLYMSHYAVHVPVAKDKRFYQKYLDLGLDEKEAAYAALVEGMDKSLGDLMDYLEKNNLDENTIILFMSDNGGLSATNALGGKLHTHNRPLNSGKGSAYEGGIREPMIVSWPGVVKPGTCCDDYLIIEDFYPTLLEMAQLKTPDVPQTIDGRSFVPLLTRKGPNPSIGRSLYWNFPNNWGPTGPGIGATCTIRKGDWKLIYYYEDARKELFNIRKDIGEKYNLAGQEPELVETLSKELGTYLREVNAQRPYFKETGREALWPDETVKAEVTLSDKTTPVSEDNIFRDPDYYNWCSSIIKGDDGKYHLFYSRWERSKTFNAWLTHSKVAYAIADRPEGPYKYVNTVIDLDKKQYKAGDMITAHNPKIKYFNGKYYLYFCSTKMERDVTDKEMTETARTGYSHPNWKPLRVNQRTFVASASSLNGKWIINKEPLLEPNGPIETLVVNPAITQGPDKRYYLIIKGDKPGSTKFERNQAVAVSDYPDRDFKIQPEPVIQDWDTEDVSMWYDQFSARFYAIFHAHTYIGMMTSINGVNWQKAIDFTVMNKRIAQTGGNPDILPDRMERPFVFNENNKPIALSLAVKKDNDAYIVIVPLKQ